MHFGKSGQGKMWRFQLFTAILIICSVSMGNATTWKNSTLGIHAFLTFDSRAEVDDIKKYGHLIDYVWGSSSKNIDTWRSVNNDVVLSRKLPTLTLTRTLHPNSRSHAQT